MNFNGFNHFVWFSVSEIFDILFVRTTLTDLASRQVLRRRVNLLSFSFLEFHKWSWNYTCKKSLKSFTRISKLVSVFNIKSRSIYVCIYGSNKDWKDKQIKHLKIFVAPTKVFFMFGIQEIVAFKYLKFVDKYKNTVKASPSWLDDFVVAMGIEIFLSLDDFIMYEVKLFFVFPVRQLFSSMK